MFVKNLALAGLFDQYAPLLGERHRTVFDLYYNQDLSLGEIAEMVGISRQGVRESIKKAEEELTAFEAGLHLSQRAGATERAAAHLLALAGDNPELCAAAQALVDATGMLAGGGE